MAIKTHSTSQQIPCTVKEYGDYLQFTIFVNEEPVYKENKDGEKVLKGYTYDFNQFTFPSGKIDRADVEEHPGNYLNYVTYDKALQDCLASAVQEHMDSTARERNYDDIQSVCTYALSTNPKFKAEAEACIAWRDAVWTYCYTVIDDVMSGKRAVPTAQELISELPKLDW